mmetsp:Transcript_56554/g.157595  ORF Transcript_56554/g.157595 Transcript_56554/m.157595 type:complete len:149 (+) Transcript_56554:212-658(+)
MPALSMLPTKLVKVLGPLLAMSMIFGEPAASRKPGEALLRYFRRAAGGRYLHYKKSPPPLRSQWRRQVTFRRRSHIEAQRVGSSRVTGRCTLQWRVREDHKMCLLTFRIWKKSELRRTFASRRLRSGRGHRFDSFRRTAYSRRSRIPV